MPQYAEPSSALRTERSADDPTYRLNSPFEPAAALSTMESVPDPLKLSAPVAVSDPPYSERLWPARSSFRSACVTACTPWTAPSSTNFSVSPLLASASARVNDA